MRYFGQAILQAAIMFSALTCPAQVGWADDAATDKQESKEAPKEVLVETQHETTIDGKTLSYKATAGKLMMKSDSLESRAEMFFVAYTRDGAEASQRPITFCFNGGPGSSSVWLHLGMLGPKFIRFSGRCVVPEATLSFGHKSVFIAGRH